MKIDRSRRRLLGASLLGALIVVALAGRLGASQDDNACEAFRGKTGHEARSALERIAPSVVRIDIDEPALPGAPGGWLGEALGPWPLDAPLRPDRQRLLGLIVDARGHVLTATRGEVSPGARVRVCLHDGRECPARFAGHDPETGLAVVTVQDPPRDLVPARPTRRGATSDALLLGTSRSGYAPYRGTLSLAGVSGSFLGVPEPRGEAVETWPGAPVIDATGDVVGLCTKLESWSTPLLTPLWSAAVVPFRLALRLGQQLAEKGEVVPGWLGADVAPMTWPALLPGGLLPSFVPRTFLVVGSVEDGSPAARAGLGTGDLIEAIDEERLESADEWNARLRACGAGATVRLDVWRRDQRRTIPVELARKASPAAARPESVSAPAR